MVRQRNKNDCVVAAVARAVGKSYAAVKRACGTTRGGLDRHELEWLLGKFGVWRQYSPRKTMTAGGWAAKNRKGVAVLVVLQDFFLLSTHALSCVDGVLFDPTDGSDSHPGRLLYAYVKETYDVP